MSIFKSTTDFTTDFIDKLDDYGLNKRADTFSGRFRPYLWVYSRLRRSHKRADPKIPRNLRDYKAFERVKTLRSLENYDFSSIFEMTNPENQVQCLNSIMISVFHNSVPLKR
jgi:hypothetical protein